MKRISIISLIIITSLSVVTVAAQKKVKEKTSESEKTRQVIEAMFAAFNRHDAEAMAELYSEDAFLDSSDFSAPKRGKQAVRETYSKYFKQSPDIKDEVKSIVVCGDKAFVEFVSSGTIEIPPPGAPSELKGQKFTVKIATVLEVKNGKIVRDVSYFDQ